MEKTFKILVALVLICSCSEDEEQTISTDWHTELIGVGYIGENPDSLNWPFSYYPCENNQPELLNHQYELQPVIIGDTIIFPNILLYNMFRDMEIDNRISKDSSKLKTFSLFKISALYIQVKGPIVRLKNISYPNINPIIIAEHSNTRLNRTNLFFIFSC